MADSLSADQRYSLIVRGLPRVDEGNIVKNILDAGKNPKGFWATAPTGKPHIGYFVPLIKVAEFVKAGVDVNTYAFCVNYRYPFEQVTQRTRYYRFLAAAVLDTLGVPLSAVTFVNGSSYEFSKKFTIDNYKLCAIIDQQDARDAAEEYARATKLSVLFCPGLQSLAEEYLDADFQLGGEDQDGIFAFSDEFLPQLGYRKRAHLFNALMPGLSGSKMPSSVTDSKIEFLDSSDAVWHKIMKASEDGVLAVIDTVLAPIHQLFLESKRGLVSPNGINKAPPAKRDNVNDTTLNVNLAPGDQSSVKAYFSYADIKADFLEGRLSAHASRITTANAINALLDPIRSMFEANEEWREAEYAAYPEG
ncbi:tyrosyl-tRNA synthetase [Xylogone sp. PMI_703]|nr:tyrosyl-tRNA synthetase [Xylogone sp. PMI_703]